MRKVGFCLLVLSLGGCLIQGNKQNLMDSLHEYNSGLRWGRIDRMAEYVPPKKRDRLIAMQQQREDVQITGCEVAGVKLAKKDRAVATVLIEWYLSSQGRLQRTYVEQTWVQQDSHWRVAEQRIIRGAPFPLL